MGDGLQWEESLRACSGAVERRKASRYCMEARVKFCWKTPGGGNFCGEAKTRDLSIAGTFVLAPTCPPLHSILEMEIALPWRSQELRCLIRAWMIVVRVERDAVRGVDSGFAAFGKAFSLKDVSIEPYGVVWAEKMDPGARTIQ